MLLKNVSRRIISICALSSVAATATFSLQAKSITVPNASFELPLTVFADPRVDSWQETPKPAWYDETGGYTWDQLVGVFLNSSPTNADHIDNIDGSQALYLFAVPQAGVFQDYDTVDWAEIIPTHEFNATFEAGKSYKLTAGFIGGGGGMTNGVSVEMSLYYRDASSNKVTVVATNIIHSNTVFTNTTHFIDIQLALPLVTANHAWTGKKIGIQFLSTVDPALSGGYWDIDNVRLTAIREPVLRNPVFTNGQFQATLLSEPGLRFDMLRTTNIALASTNWLTIATVTNSTGTTVFTDSNAGASLNFYRARQLP
ncbi:MAG: hypothetical protein ABIP71_16005 [Verrucomicrobiota bacterium]